MMNSYFLVMKYAEQGSLADYLKINKGRLTWGDRLRLAYQITEALDFIHDGNVIHHDLHSGNILGNVLSSINATRRALIADFGLSRLASAETSKLPVEGRVPYVYIPNIFPPRHVFRFIFYPQRPIRNYPSNFASPTNTKVPPERIWNPKVKHDVRGDVYSLGVIFWEISADGTLPFPHADFMTPMHICQGMRRILSRARQRNTLSSTPSVGMAILP
ncbi:kinase-like domain-containing protein [Jimgerdemannia flammicorona]|uniref:Kinase-like domain-containing protein n=1 Tax=Jimgerdemannia flammicorona TaxID=994334 RepID=A0A433DBJ6_9FUNG|nr:kinase-like domain-containing protein [Jimgerdemannia flammicorona]